MRCCGRRGVGRAGCWRAGSRGPGGQRDAVGDHHRGASTRPPPPRCVCRDRVSRRHRCSGSGWLSTAGVRRCRPGRRRAGRVPTTAAGRCSCSAQSAAACSMWRRARSAVACGDDRLGQRWPGGQERLVRDPHHDGAVVEVGGHQPARHEGVQLGGHLARDSSSRGTRHRVGPALLVHGDQPQQLLDHLHRGLGRWRRWRRRGRRRPAGPAPPAPHPAAHTGWLSSRPPRPTPVGQLGQRVGQQRQRLPAVGVGDQPRHQLVVDVDAGQPRRALDHRAQRLPRSGRTANGRPPSSSPASSGHGSSWSRNSGRSVPPPAPGPPAPAQQAGEPGPLGGRGLGQQLLELVDHDQQLGPARSGRGQQQVVGQLGEPARVKPAGAPRQPDVPADAP